MSIKKLFKSNKNNKTSKKESVSLFSSNFTDEEMESLRIIEREMYWSYSIMPPVGFPGCFWHI